MSNLTNSSLYEYEYSYEQWERYINSYVFDELDRKLLVRFLLDNATYEDIAKETGYSRETIRTRITKSKKRLSKLLVSNNIIKY